MTTLDSFIPELEAVIAQGSVERRVKALDHLTSMFLSVCDTLDENKIEILDELFLRLSTDIEMVARRALALRLADEERAPRRTIMSLAEDDEIQVAQPILSRSKRLDDAALIKIITTKSQEYLLAVSIRQSLAPSVTDVLVTRGDPIVLRSTARNKGARFSEQGYKRLVARTEDDDELAESVGSRQDIPRYLFLEVLKKASEAVRAKLQAAHPALSQEIERTIADVVGVIRKKAIEGARNYEAARNQVQSLQAAGRLGAGEVEAFACAGLIEETVVALAALGNLSIEVVERALMQDRSELLIIMARAIGLPWSTTKSLLVLRGGSTGVSVAAVEQALAAFERLKPSTAQQAIRFYLLRGKV